MVIHLAFLLKPVNERLGDCLYSAPGAEPERETGIEHPVRLIEDADAYLSGVGTIPTGFYV